MSDLESLVENLNNRPILLSLESDQFGGAIGALSISRNSKDIAFTYMRNTHEGFMARAFKGESPYGKFYISLHGGASASGGRINGQHELDYDYILFSKYDDAVYDPAFTVASFQYHTFIEGIPVDDDPIVVSLFNHIKKMKRKCDAFEIDVNLRSQQRGQSFPRKKVIEYNHLEFCFTFRKPKTVREIRSTLHELNNYLALFTQTPMKPVEILLANWIEDDGRRLPKLCYLIESDSLSSIPKPVDKDGALSFSRQGKDFLRHLTNAIYLQDEFYVPLNLMRVYWVYKDKEVYLDNQVSVLLATVDALYQLIKVPSSREVKRTDEYTEFIKQLDDITVSQKIKRWLTDAESFYTDPRAFKEKVKLVVEYAGSTITDDKARLLNDLRNDLMHGRLPEWDKYLSNYFEQRTATEGDKINIKWLAWVLSNAVLRLIQDTAQQKRSSSKRRES